MAKKFDATVKRKRKPPRTLPSIHDGPHVKRYDCRKSCASKHYTAGGQVRMLDPKSPEFARLRDGGRKPFPKPGIPWNNGDNPGIEQPARLDAIDAFNRGIAVGKERAEREANNLLKTLQVGRWDRGMHIVLVGDIVSGFEAYGPFITGEDAVNWWNATGVREFTQGQRFLMQLKEAKHGKV